MRVLSFAFFLLTCFVAIPHAKGAAIQKDNSYHPIVSSIYSPRLSAQNDFPFSKDRQQSDFLIVASEMVVQAVAINPVYTADYLIGKLEQRQPNHSFTDFCREQGQHLFLQILFRQIIAPNAP